MDNEQIDLPMWFYVLGVTLAVLFIDLDKLLFAVGMINHIAQMVFASLVKLTPWKSVYISQARTQEKQKGDPRRGVRQNSSRATPI
jgi:hypothetical protein